MDPILGMQPLFAAFALVAAGAISVLAITLLWSASQWGAKTHYRVGEQMRNARVIVSEWSGVEGYVHVDGELWRACADEALTPGDRVEVTKVDGLILEVTKNRDNRTTGAATATPQ